MAKKLAPEIAANEQQFILDWNNGMLITEMTVKYKVSHSTITKHSKRLGLKPRKKPTIKGSIYALDERTGSWIRDKNGVSHWRPGVIDINKRRAS